MRMDGQTGRQTDRHNEADSRFDNLGTRLKLINLDTIIILAFTPPCFFVFSLLILLMKFRAHMAFCYAYRVCVFACLMVPLYPRKKKIQKNWKEKRRDCEG